MEESATEVPSPLELYRQQRRDTLTRAFLAQQQQRAPKLATPRTMPRARLTLPLTLHWHDWETDLQTIEVSGRGCSFFMYSAPPQETFGFTLELSHDVCVRGRGRVVATVQQDERHYVCVRFELMSAVDATLAEDCVLEALLCYP